MKALIVQNFGGLGGGSRSCFDISLILRDLGYDIDLIVDNPDDAVKETAKSLNFRLLTNYPSLVTYTFHSASGFSLKTIVKYLLSKKRLKAWDLFFKSNRFDLVILNSSVLSPLIPIIKTRGIKCIVFVRETFRKSFLINKKQKRFLAFSDAVVYLTEFDKNRWNCGLKKYVIPEVISAPMSCEPQSFIFHNSILFLGGLSYFKGALDLLKSIDYLKKRKGIDVQLYVLGNDYLFLNKGSILSKLYFSKHILYRNKCFKLIDRINKQGGSIKMIGLTHNVGNYYEKCDFVVFPVKKVHQPRPTYEAGFYKKTVVIPDYDNFKENIIDGFNGVYYRKNSFKSLALAIHSLINNPKFIEQLGHNNYLMSLRHHTRKNAEVIISKIITDLFS